MAPELFKWDLRRHEALKDWMSSQEVSVLVEVLMEAAKAFDEIRNAVLIETREETLLETIRRGTVSTNCCTNPATDVATHRYAIWNPSKRRYGAMGAKRCIAGSDAERRAKTAAGTRVAHLGRSRV